MSVGYKLWFPCNEYLKLEIIKLVSFAIAICNNIIPNRKSFQLDTPTMPNQKRYLREQNSRGNTLFNLQLSKTEIGDIDDLVHLAQYTMSDSSGGA